MKVAWFCIVLAAFAAVNGRVTNRPTEIVTATTDPVNKPTPGTVSTPSTARPFTAATTGRPTTKPTDSASKPTPGTSSIATISIAANTTSTTVTATILTTEPSVPALCLLAPDPGPCKAGMRRFFYNATSGQCELFIYGGCGGNENNFEDLAECQSECLSQKPTEGDPESSSGEECEIHGQVYMDCGTACPSVCGEEQPEFCVDVCVSGCQCPPHTHLDRNQSACVRECPIECEIPGQLFMECGTACPPVCGEEQLAFCTLQCVRECQCPAGTILDRNQSACVRECPTGTPTTGNTSEPTIVLTTTTPTSPPPECEIPGQVFMECGTACPPVCGEEQPGFCILLCVRGCQCPAGTILDRNQSACVRECPTGTPTTGNTTEPTIALTTTTPTTSPPECDIRGQVFMECGTACPPVCGEEQSAFCTLQCVRGCQCPAGTYLDRNQSACVNVCPIKCDIPGQEFMECGTACPPVCGKEQLGFCLALCVSECQCPAGTILDENQPACVRECPTDTPTTTTDIPTTATATGRPTFTAGTSTETRPTPGIEVDICSLPKDTGSGCEAKQLRRYYYDAAKNMCRRFVYSGCGGNANRFKSYQKCRNTCMT